MMFCLNRGVVLSGDVDRRCRLVMFCLRRGVALPGGVVLLEERCRFVCSIYHPVKLILWVVN